MIRDQIVEDIKKEVCGPDPHPAYLDPDTREEILLERVHGSPKLRYGAGMLYPQSTELAEVDENNEIEEEDDDDEVEADVHNTRARLSDEPDSDQSIGLANEFLPSALGFTCKLKYSENEIVVDVNSAWYERSDIEVPEKRVVPDPPGYDDKYNVATQEVVLRRNWIRRVLEIEPVKLNIAEIGSRRGRVFEQTLVITPWNQNQGWLRLEVFDRSRQEDIDKGERIFTFTIINNVRASGDFQEDDRAILFQNELILTDELGQSILPYVERQSANDTPEEEELRLLYRDKKTYGIGHGCSVQWDEQGPSMKKLYSTVIPVYELPQVSPTHFVNLSMFELSDLGNWESAKESLQNLVSSYGSWISDLHDSAQELEGRFVDAAIRNVEKCRDNLSRIEEGVNMLVDSDENSEIVKCFRWMNRAMIWQQQRSKTPRREWIQSGTWRNSVYTLETLPDKALDFISLSEFHEQPYSGKWRPFQIAFVLMNIKSIWEPQSEDRNIVDLIWFPTGGGKTEAYLGLAGFAIFARRIRGRDFVDIENHGGTSILMRYTLRLLTTQQYERASSLICASELIRRDNPELGIEPISIGLWVGSASTPNSRRDATKLYDDLIGDNFRTAEYNFIVMKCPCCGSGIGQLEKPSQQKKLVGIKKSDGRSSNSRVYFSCENDRCEFHNEELPLYVVDEDIFQICPTLVLGTVDKFAMVPWKPGSASIFGFREQNGKVRITPPELIIQDELHLISGPLGTMVGLYETLIQTLCNNYNRSSSPFYTSDNYVSAKIVASSATISRAAEQVKALYSNENINIFPPQGISFGNTWFSEEIEPSIEVPGRKYIGILAPGYRSGQTSVVRLYSSILQSVQDAEYPPEVKDYYWTLLGFFNSIRELGMAASLVYADIREYLSTLQNRKLVLFDQRRRLNLLKELTSRIPSSQIPNSLKELEKKYNGTRNSALDVCIATNMIATGVDVSRLGLMIIHGQPKTTAEYIQASSRVGRDTKKGPGLVVMLYSPSKPRDKSQYEHFQSFHNKIYSHVEPTSVTPFSISARERALHAVLIGLVRNFSDSSLTENPDISNNENEFEELVSWIRNLIHDRCSLIDPSELQNTMNLFERRVEFWKSGFQYYGDARNSGMLNQGRVPLMYTQGSEVTEEIRTRGLSLPTQTSMRGVDEEGKVGILNIH
tara:strand:+ start:8899 stop:12417 length:3519 start_codon:yes stop_codon:yes gene_type:complete